MKRLFIILCLVPLIVNVDSQVVNIWNGTNVHKKVLMTAYLSEGKGNKAVVICPGGSYFWHDTENEGHMVAHWLQQNHISAFVLIYRTAYVPAFAFHTRLFYRGNQYPDPQNDLQQAILYIREHADEYGVDRNQIGAMGFSAGGHLVMSVAENYHSPESRPKFVASIYPVVSMSHPCTHKRSRRGLLGEYKKFNKNMRDSLSLEKHVPEDCPPVFLVNCADDPIVKCYNSVLLDSALTSKNIQHKYIQYKTGGHGFGVSTVKGTAECRQWKGEFLHWLFNLKLNS